MWGVRGEVQCAGRLRARALRSMATSERYGKPSKMCIRRREVHRACEGVG